MPTKRGIRSKEKQEERIQRGQRARAQAAQPDTDQAAVSPAPRAVFTSRTAGSSAYKVKEEVASKPVPQEAAGNPEGPDRAQGALISNRISRRCSDKFSGLFVYFWGPGPDFKEKCMFFIVLTCFLGFSAQNHAESLGNHPKKSFLDPKRAKFSKSSKSTCKKST